MNIIGELFKEKCSSEIREEDSVVNKRRKFGEDIVYYQAFFKTNDGENIPLLFTKKQIDVAMKRASNNMEDIVDKSNLIEKILD